MRKYYLTSYFILMAFAGFAQTGKSVKNASQHQIRWNPPVKFEISENESLTLLNFEGAQYDASNKFLPVYRETFPSVFDNSVTEVKVELVNDAYSPLDEVSLISNPSLIDNKIIVIATIGYERKKPVLSYSFIPIRKNPVTNAFEKLISFDIKISPLKTVTITNQAPRYYAPNSVLATGTWYKIGVTADGVYKITSDFIKQLGIDTSTLDPRNIKIFGNGGGMLPNLNATPRADDLVQNAIEVVGESDGHFNTGDYILFFGQSPNRWYLDASDNQFHHVKNLFSDTTYYFLTPDLSGSSKRISMQASLSPTSNDIQISSFDDYLFHENNFTNFIKSGRNFYGEPFDINLTQSFSFNFPNIITSSPVYFKTNVMAHSFTASSFDIRYQGQIISSVNNIPAVGTDYTADYGNEKNSIVFFNAVSPTLSFDFTYKPPASTSIGYLDYIELNARRSLAMSGNQMMFRDKNSVSTNNASYTLSNYNIDTKIWNVTDIYNITEQSSSGGNFIVPASQNIHEFIAFNSIGGFFTPRSHGKIENQNLHSLGQTDLIIVANPKFISEANRLGDFHRTNDNLRVVVADINQVYNEYSSGAKDVTAIRDFAKMFYDRSLTDIPRYLLLFGDGSYINKEDYQGNTNYIPTYESENSLSLIHSFVSDDYFGHLDSLEGLWTIAEYLDVGMGRFPVKSLEEAKDMVDKVIRYTLTGTVTDPTACNNTNSTLGDWRNVICLIGDDEDHNIHLNANENLLAFSYPFGLKYNVDKIYLDAYQQIATPGGNRYPDVNDAINKRMKKGAFLMNYVGHGGELGLAHESILGNEMIAAWDNSYSMPLFITATCEFSRFDDPGRTSAGENVLLNPLGGGIALYSTTRLAFAGANETLDDKLVYYIFQDINGEKPRLGDIYRLTKNALGGDNFRNFSLFGDPALRLAYPKYDIIATKINGQNLVPLADTVNALSKITITGEVQSNGQKLSNFNGVVYPTVFDKAVNVRTLANDWPLSDTVIFKLQKNVLYKGKASVTNGDFSFTFIVPKDIAYNFGTGRLSFYAQNGSEDASGYYDSLIIGGISQNSQTDFSGPDVKLYLNNEKFVFGGITDQHPKIFAIVSDSTGINTVGNGIGHDITAVLDGKSDPVYTLNDYYESDLNSYQSGKIYYSLDKLEDGRHTLKLKVWDIYNNSSEAYTEFVVASDAKIALTHVLNYPNPFTTHTTFFFEHNQACNDLDVQIQIYTVSGKLIKTLNNHLLCEGYRSDKIEWDGKDDFGDQIARGVYIYRLKVRTTNGNTAEKFEKLVVLR